MEMLRVGLLVAAAVVAAGLVVFGCYRALKTSGKKSRERGPDRCEPRPFVSAAREPILPATEPEPAQAVREFVPGPALTRRDDAFYAVVSGAIAETLAAEGINPEGGFQITSIKTVNDPAAPKLTMKDGALYAVITAAIAQVLALEGVNPEGGFTIQSVRAL